MANWNNLWIASVDKDIIRLRQIINLTPSGVDPTHRANAFLMLSRFLTFRFECQSTANDLEKALYFNLRVLEIAPEGYANLQIALNRLGALYHTRFEYLGHIQDLEQQIPTLTRLIKITADNNQDLPGYLCDLGGALLRRFQHQGHIQSLEDGLTFVRRATELTLPSHSLFLEVRNHLGSALHIRFERFGDLKDMEEAISVQRNVVELELKPDPSHLGGLANLLFTRFTRLGDRGDLDKAIVTSRQAIQITSDNGSHLVPLLSTLATSLCARFERTHLSDDVEEAVSVMRRALSARSPQHPNFPITAMTFANALILHFDCTDAIEDLDECISTLRDAVDRIAPGDLYLPMSLSNLGTYLCTRFQRLGQIKDIDEAVTTLTRAGRLLPRDHPSFSILLIGLGNALGSRSARLHSVVDIEGAISSARAAIDLTPRDHPLRSIHLSTLGSLIQRRCLLNDDMKDMDEAIGLLREAVQCTYSGDGSLPETLCSLGTALRVRFDETRDPKDSDEAIAILRHAVQEMGESSLRSQIPRINLADSLRARYEEIGDIKDLEDAILHLDRAIKLSSGDFPGLPMCRINLGNCYRKRFTRNREPHDFDRAILAYRESSICLTGNPLLKLKAAVKWAELSRSEGNLTLALSGYSAAISLLPQVAWIGQSATSRQQLLSQEPSRLATDAAACAVAQGDLERAIELLDQGRAVFWSQALEFRDDWAELHQVDSALAKKLDQVARDLDRGSFEDHHDVDDRIRRTHSIEGASLRRCQAEEWEDLVTRVRKIPSFENFLRPPSFSQLRLSSIAGPVVVINVSEYRCDALVVNLYDPILHIPLAKTSRSELTDFAEDIRNDRNLGPILQALWLKIVWPIFDKLGYLRCTVPNWPKPRVWWCPTGPLTFLPLHAAGPYKRGGGPDATKCVISSYTSSLSALLRARSRAMPGKAQMLAVGLSEAAGQKPLGCAAEEVEMIRTLSLARGFECFTLQDEAATISGVFQKMAEVGSVHFSCHGIQDQHSPMESALHLYDGPLRLATIVSNSLAVADFAFLSACQTARGAAALSDEAMHIAAGMQVAGYRSIVATLWSIGDSVGLELAKEFYEHYIDPTSSKLDPAKAAFCLNEAILCLRKKNYTASQLVPFVHIGI
jgi:tetratricopeptide (TPR) repeat protein